MSPPVKKSNFPYCTRSPMLHMFSEGRSSAGIDSSGGENRGGPTPAPPPTRPVAPAVGGSAGGKTPRFPRRHDLIGAADPDRFGPRPPLPLPPTQEAAQA